MKTTLGLSEPSTMMQILTWELVRCLRYKRVASILLIRMARPGALPFPSVPQNAGEIDELVRRNMREVDLVSSYGGRGLLVLLPETGKQGALAAAERLRGIISRELSALPTPPGLAPVMVSIGAAAFPENADTAYDLLSSAESALLEAEAKGGNCVVVAETLDSRPTLGH